jgi:hypothetical protein
MFKRALVGDAPQPPQLPLYDPSLVSKASATATSFVSAHPIAAFFLFVATAVSITTGGAFMNAYTWNPFTMNANKTQVSMTASLVTSGDLRAGFVSLAGIAANFDEFREAASTNISLLQNQTSTNANGILTLRAEFSTLGVAVTNHVVGLQRLAEIAFTGNITNLLGILDAIELQAGDLELSIRRLNQTQQSQYSEILERIANATAASRAYTDSIRALLDTRVDGVETTVTGHTTTLSYHLDQILNLQRRTDALNQTLNDALQSISSINATTIENRGLINGTLASIDALQATDTSLQSQINALNPTVTYEVFVATDGSDYTGMGSNLKPYRTIQKALQVIGNITTDIYANIRLKPGQYDEVGTIFLTPRVWIVGAIASSTRITASSGLIELSHAFGNITSTRAGLKEVSVVGSTVVNFNLQPIGGNGTIAIDIQRVRMNNAFTFRGRFADRDILEVKATDFLGSVSLYSVQFSLQHSYIGATFTVSDVGSQAITTSTLGVLGDIVGGKVVGATTFTKTLNLVWRVDATAWGTFGALTTTATTGTQGNMVVNVDQVSVHVTRTIGANTDYSIKGATTNVVTLTLAGIATLNGAGQFTIATTQVTSTSALTCTLENIGVAPTGSCQIDTRTPGTSFRVKSSVGATDAGVRVNWVLMNTT